jgi:rubrerythrin
MENTMKSITIALENELKERDFYLKHSQRTQNPVGKRMFECIAEDENEHYNRLKELHALLSKQGKWPETIPITIKGTNIKNVLKGVLKDVDKTPSSDVDDKKALTIAIDFETKGYNFYSHLRDCADTESEKNFFDRLASIEKEHLSSLKDTQLFLEDPATWHEEHEKPHFEG